MKALFLAVTMTKLMLLFHCAAFAFQHVATSETTTLRPLTSFQLISTKRNSNFLYKSNRNDIVKCMTQMQKRSLSSSSLFLFGTNNNNDNLKNASKGKLKQQPKDKSGVMDGDSGETFLTKYVEPTLSILKVAFPSFIAGTVVTLSVLFLPMISDYYEAFHSDTSSGNFYGGSSSKSINKEAENNINQPVILFETILNDLNNAYVDDVNIQKLFETGVKAMTASLDPYTEFESRQEAQELEESVTGRYGGVGLVIRGSNVIADASEDVELSISENTNMPISPEAKKEKISNPPIAVKDFMGADWSFRPKDTFSEDDEAQKQLSERKRKRLKSMEDGIRVVSAFEGYAFDAGLRVGDKLLAIDDFQIKPSTTVEEVRNHLRGQPGTPVSIKFQREGGGGLKSETLTISMQRSVVHIPDVKYFGFIGDPKDGIGYIDLSGFANDAGREVRYAIKVLQHGADMIAKSEDTTNVADIDGNRKMSFEDIDTTKLKGLILDLRSNPGGLLTSAVDVSTLFVPNGSNIVSAKGRGFPETIYRSKTEPLINQNTRLAVLVNEQTASAAEIVTGAIQDLDVGLVVGKGRTYGKGLVQNVQDLPYQTALKYTVAKYYTPSGRCIQSTIYEEGGRDVSLIVASKDDAKGQTKSYKSKKVADKDRTVFHTAHGREVKDGGGIEVDFKVEPQKASPIEIVLLNSGIYSDYAAEWSKHNELTDDFKVDDTTYQDFQKFVRKRQMEGDLKLEVLYDSQLKELQKTLKASNFDSSSRELEKLRSEIIADVKKDFKIYKAEIIEDIEQNILARYVPESMLIEHGLRSDIQVKETARLLKDGKEFDKLLAREGTDNQKNNIQTVFSPKSGPVV